MIAIKKAWWDILISGPKVGVALALWYVFIVGLAVGCVISNFEKNIAWFSLVCLILWLLADYYLRKIDKQFRIKLGVVAFLAVGTTYLASYSKVDTRLRISNSFKVKVLPVVYTGGRMKDYHSRVLSKQKENQDFVVYNTTPGAVPLESCILIELWMFSD